MFSLCPCPVGLNDFRFVLNRLDEILSGGLVGGEVLEIYGKYRTGKTQLCLAIAAQLCHFREEKLSVVYFDLKNDFRATRFLSFCQGVENVS